MDQIKKNGHNEPYSEQWSKLTKFRKKVKMNKTGEMIQVAKNGQTEPNCEKWSK